MMTKRTRSPIKCVASLVLPLVLISPSVKDTRADGPPNPPAVQAAVQEDEPPSWKPPAEADGAYEAMEGDARRLAANIGMPSDRRETALSRLRTAFQRGKIGAFAKNSVLSGIFAYQMGEGGFIIKVKKGKGLVHIAGQPRDIPLSLKSITFGAQVGGGSEWGFGVILGLHNAARFGGDYRGDTRGATAAEESISITKLVKKDVGVMDEAYHELYLIGAAAGLSAGAAIGSLSITPQG